MRQESCDNIVWSCVYVQTTLPFVRHKICFCEVHVKLTGYFITVLNFKFSLIYLGASDFSFFCNLQFFGSNMF